MSGRDRGLDSNIWKIELYDIDDENEEYAICTKCTAKQGGTKVRIKCEAKSGGTTSGLIRHLLKTSAHTIPEEDNYVKKYKELEAKKILESPIVKEELAKKDKEIAEELAKKDKEIAEELAKIHQEHAKELAKMVQEYEEKLAKQVEEKRQKDNEIGKKMRMENKQKALDKQKALVAAGHQPQQNLPAESSSIPIPSATTKFSTRGSLPFLTDIVPPVGELPENFLDIGGEDESVKESTVSSDNKMDSPHQHAGVSGFKPKSPMKRKFPTEEEKKEE